MNQSADGSPRPPTSPAVRLAWPAEAAAIAEVQRRAWQQSAHAEAMEQVSPGELTEAWNRAIIAPPMAHFRVLVAHDGAGTVTGFTAIGPNDDPDAGSLDAEIAEFVVDPDHRGQGHGSRLLAAAVDTLRADGYQRVVWWVEASDDRLRNFGLQAGWGPDGAHREIAIGETESRLAQVRLHTDIRRDNG